MKDKLFSMIQVPNISLIIRAQVRLAFKNVVCEMGSCLSQCIKDISAISQSEHLIIHMMECMYLTTQRIELFEIKKHTIVLGLRTCFALYCYRASQFHHIIQGHFTDPYNDNTGYYQVTWQDYFSKHYATLISDKPLDYRHPYTALEPGYWCA